MFLAEIICGIALASSLVEGGLEHYEIQNNIAELNLLPVSSHTEVTEKTVMFYLYTRSNGQTPQQLELNNTEALKNSDFNPKRKTLVLVHGWKNSMKSGSVQDIKDAALESYDLNVIGVDWYYFTKRLDYGFPLSNTSPIGDYVSKFIEFLIANGLSPKDLHLVGHSLGAHVMGYAGKRLQANGHKVARITGLDPAFPGFYNVGDAEHRLNATDADYVDCIHTCGGILGIPDPICQGDFYPNGGQNIQPGCSAADFSTCSHGRAFQFFAESFNSSHLFNAQTCQGTFLWVPIQCHDEGALMGYPAGDRMYQGIFSLTTNGEYPFAKNVTATY